MNMQKNPCSACGYLIKVGKFHIFNLTDKVLADPVHYSMALPLSLESW